MTNTAFNGVDRYYDAAFSLHCPCITVFGSSQLGDVLVNSLFDLGRRGSTDSGYRMKRKHKQQNNSDKKFHCQAYPV